MRLEASFGAWVSLPLRPTLNHDPPPVYPRLPFSGQALWLGNRSLAGFDGIADDAVRQVIVDEAAGLHERIGRCRPDEAEAVRFEPFRERPRPVRLARDVGPRPRRGPARRAMRPDQVG